MIENDEQNKKYGNEANEPNFNQSDNDYGLPEAEYNPIQREQPEINHGYAAENVEEKDIQPQRQNSSWPMWLALGVILLLAGIFVYFFVFDTPEQANEVAQTPEQSQGTNTYVVEEETTPAEQPIEEEWNNEPEVVEGSVASIGSRTGRYYMIVGSFVDQDLAQDYAEKLAKDGYQVKIIEPSGTRKFYRLSVKDAEGIANLTPELEGMRAKYGENVWIVKY